MKQVRVEPRSSTRCCPHLLSRARVRAADVGRRPHDTQPRAQPRVQSWGWSNFLAWGITTRLRKKIRKVYVQFGAVCYPTKKPRKMLGESVPFFLGGGSGHLPTHPPVVALMHSAAKPPAVFGAVDRWDRQTDGRKDARPFHRLCCAYYAGTVSRFNCSGRCNHKHNRTAEKLEWTSRVGLWGGCPPLLPPLLLHPLPSLFFPSFFSGGHWKPILDYRA